MANIMSAGGNILTRPTGGVLATDCAADPCDCVIAGQLVSIAWGECTERGVSAGSDSGTVGEFEAGVAYCGPWEVRPECSAGVWRLNATYDGVTFSLSASCELAGATCTGGKLQGSCADASVGWVVFSPFSTGTCSGMSVTLEIEDP